MTTEIGQWNKNYSDEEILDYWDNHRDEIICKSVPINQLSNESIICDYFPTIDKEFASNILDAIPDNFDPDQSSGKIDEDLVLQLIQEKNFPELKKYFNTLMPATTRSKRNREIECSSSMPPPKIATSISRQQECFSPDQGNAHVKIPTMMQSEDSQMQSSIAPPTDPPLLNTLRPVPKADLIKHPYRSVGKLFWFRPEHPDYVEGTGFYVGDGKLVTVAHNFEEKASTKSNRFIFPFNLMQARPEFPQRPLRNAVFIPAMIDKKDSNGELYGRYTIKDVKPHKEYKIRYWKNDLFYPMFDICSATLGIGGKNNEKEYFHPEPTSQDEATSLEPLPLLPYQPFESQQRVWSVIGYAGDLYEGRMLQMEGVECNGKAKEDVIDIHLAAKQGMSGGPWLLLNEARGIQSSKDIDNPISSSPRITKDMLSEINLPFHSKENTE